MRRRFYDIAVCAGLAAAVAALAAFPSEATEAARDGLTLCLNVVVPSLFPFFVVSSLIVRLRLAERAGRLLAPVTRALFGVGGAAAAALALGLVGGYPVGARMTAALYESGAVTKDEAERLLAFCNNSGPAFILGVVGGGVFGSGAIGLLLLASHIISALLVGLLFRSKSGGGDSLPPTGARVSLVDAFVDGVKSSFATALGICGFVIFFTVVIRLLTLTGALPWAAGLLGRLPFIDNKWAARLLTGLIEMCSGVWTLTGENTLPAAVAASFMLGWGGLSVHFQTLSLLSGSGLRAGRYFLGKLLQGAASAAVTCALLPLAKPYTTAASFSGLEAVSTVRFTGALAASAILAGLMLALFTLAAKKAGKNRVRSV